MSDEVEDPSVETVTTKSLIEMLEKFDPDTPVVIAMATTADSTTEDYEVGEEVIENYEISRIQEFENEETKETVIALIVDLTDEAISSGSDDDDDDEPTDSDEEEIDGE